MSSKVWSSHLFVLLQLGVVDLSDLGQLGSVVRVLRWVVCPGSSGGRCCSRCRCRTSSFLWTWYALCQQHIVQPHELWIWGLLLLRATNTQHCNDRGRSEVSYRVHTYSGVIHSNNLSAVEAECGWHPHIHQLNVSGTVCCNKEIEKWPDKSTASIKETKGFQSQTQYDKKKCVLARKWLCVVSVTVPQGPPVPE